MWPVSDCQDLLVHPDAGPLPVVHGLFGLGGEFGPGAGVAV